MMASLQPRSASNLRLLVLMTIAASAAPVVAEPAPRAAVMPLRAKRIKGEIVQILDDLLLNALGRTGRVAVIGPQEIEALLAAENLKDQIGCDSVACAAEIGGALNARYVISGSVGRLGDSVVINLTLFDTERMEASARGTSSVADDENQYAEGMRLAVANLWGLGEGSETPSVGTPSESEVPPVAASPPAFGRLRVQSIPVGATVKINGQFAGHTPLTVDELAAGYVRLEIAAERYATQSVSAIVRGNEEGTVRVEMQPWPRLTLSGPDHAVVSIDGESVGQFPYSAQLEPGEHLVRVTLTDHRDWTHRYTLNPGHDVAHEVEMQHIDAVSIMRRNQILLGVGATTLGLGFAGLTYYGVTRQMEYADDQESAEYRHWNAVSYSGAILSILSFASAYYCFTTLPAAPVVVAAATHDGGVVRVSVKW